MHNLELKFSVSTTTLTLLDEMRGGRPREDLLRQAIELGLCELLESVARTHRDYTTHVVAGQTKDYKLARNTLFSVDEAHAESPPSLESVRDLTSRSVRGS
jgi:hypothetical protein